MSGQGAEGGGVVPLRVAGGGLRRPARTLPWLQLPHGVGLAPGVRGGGHAEITTGCPISQTSLCFCYFLGF